MPLMGLQSHSDLLCEFIIQEFFGKFGVIFEIVSYVFEIKMYQFIMTGSRTAGQRDRAEREGGAGLVPEPEGQDEEAATEGQTLH